MLAGNSSSGIMETASVELPTLNVGIRQKGRMRAGNVIDVEPSVPAILSGVEQAMSDAFRSSLQGMVNPYVDGHAAERILEVLSSCPIDDRLRIKHVQEVAG